MIRRRNFYFYLVKCSDAGKHYTGKDCISCISGQEIRIPLPTPHEHHFSHLFPTFTDPPLQLPASTVAASWALAGERRRSRSAAAWARPAPLRQGICCWLQVVGAYNPGPGLGGRIGLHSSTPRPPYMTAGSAVRAGTGLGLVRRCTKRDVTCVTRAPATAAPRHQH